MRRRVGGRDGGYAARPQARLPRPQPDDSVGRARTRSAGGRLPSGREQVSGRFVGCIQAAVALPDGGGFATAQVWPDMYLPDPRQTRSHAVWGQCWCVPGRAPSRSMPSATPLRSLQSPRSMPPSAPSRTLPSDARCPPADCYDVPNVVDAFLHPQLPHPGFLTNTLPVRAGVALLSPFF